MQNKTIDKIKELNNILEVINNGHYNFEDRHVLNDNDLKVIGAFNKLKEINNCLIGKILYKASNGNFLIRPKSIDIVYNNGQFQILASGIGIEYIMTDDFLLPCTIRHGYKNYTMVLNDKDCNYLDELDLTHFKTEMTKYINFVVDFFENYY